MSASELNQLLANMDLWGGMLCGLIMALIVAITWKG